MEPISDLIMEPLISCKSIKGKWLQDPGSEWGSPAVWDPGGAQRVLSRDHFPRAAMTTKSTITTRKPAEETAAAVSSPDIAEATESPANTRRMMKRITIPRGVLITPMIEPVELLPIQHTS